MRIGRRLQSAKARVRAAKLAPERRADVARTAANARSRLQVGDGAKTRASAREGRARGAERVG